MSAENSVQTRAGAVARALEPGAAGRTDLLRLLGAAVAAALVLTLGVAQVPAQAAPAPATTTVSGWAGERQVSLGFTPTRRVTLTPGAGRTVHLQVLDGVGIDWRTISTMTAPSSSKAVFTVPLTTSSSKTTIRYRLSVPATSSAKALVTKELVVGFGQAPKPKPATSTFTDWDGEIEAGFGDVPRRTATLTPAFGRGVKLQKWTTKGWSTVRTFFVPKTEKGTFTVNLLTSKVKGTARYQLVAPARPGAAEATSGSFRVAFSATPTVTPPTTDEPDTSTPEPGAARSTFTDWDGQIEAAFGDVPRRTATLTPANGRGIKLQKWTTKGWSTVRTFFAPKTEEGTFTVNLLTSKVKGTARYQLVAPQKPGMSEATSGSFRVAFSATPTVTPPSTDEPDTSTPDPSDPDAATSTFTDWDGTIDATLNSVPKRTATLTPANGRGIKLQKWTTKGWSTVRTFFSPKSESGTFTVSLLTSKVKGTARYQLVAPQKPGMSEATTGSLYVAFAGKEGSTISGWPAATSKVPYSRSASRTVTTQPGRSVQLQQFTSGSWKTVKGYVAGVDGEVKVALPTIWQTAHLYYRVVVPGTTTYTGATSGTWTIDVVAPPMPDQKYNGEVREAVDSWNGYTNGAIPTAVLCSPSWAKGHFSRCDADEALEAMNKAYKAEFGANMSITSTYRTYAQQVALKKSKGRMAATPGTSKHGWGLAIDFGGGINTWGSAQHNWMRQHANSYGWYHPAWAQFDGSLPEAWHWEYAGAAASGKAAHTEALAMQLIRKQSWNGAAQRRCLTDLWTITSAWNYKATGSGDVRGLPALSMRSLYGASWSSSSAAAVYLRNPQTQIEQGIKAVNAHGTPCKAVDAERAADPAQPVLGVVVGPRTIALGEGTDLRVTYTKNGSPVASENVVLQRLDNQRWVDIITQRVVDGEGTRVLKPSTVGTAQYRFRTTRTKAISPSFSVTVTAS